MKKIDSTVLKETGQLAAWVLVFSAVMQAVFLVIGQWDYTVLLGNLLSFVGVTLNFLLMGITVQSAILKEEKDARQQMRASGMLRTFFMFVILAVGVLAPIFNIFTVIIPVFFPRIIITIRGIMLNKADKAKEHNDEE